MNNQSAGEIKGITGLKGWAVLSVFLIHAGGSFRHISPYINHVIDFAKYGVIIFLVISAFTLCLSLNQKKNFSFADYIKRRFMRIAPTYFFLLIIVFSVVNVFSTSSAIQKYNFWDLFTHLTFINLSPLFPEYQGSIIAVAWVIPIMWWYYFLIPWIYFGIRRVVSHVFILLLAGVILYFNYDLLLIPHNATGGFYWTMQQFFVIYVLGISAAIILKNSKRRLLGINSTNSKVTTLLFGTAFFVYFYIRIGQRSELLYIGILLLLMLYALYIKKFLLSFLNKPMLKFIIMNIDMLLLLIIPLLYIYHNHPNPIIFTGFWGTAILICMMKESFLEKLFFENRITYFIGKISYPFFLSHTLVMSVIDSNMNLGDTTIRFFVILLVSLLISTVLHFTIENWGLGKKLIKVHSEVEDRIQHKN